MDGMDRRLECTGKELTLQRRRGSVLCVCVCVIRLYTKASQFNLNKKDCGIFSFFREMSITGVQRLLWLQAIVSTAGSVELSTEPAPPPSGTAYSYPRRPTYTRDMQMRNSSLRSRQQQFLEISLSKARVRFCSGLKRVFCWQDRCPGRFSAVRWACV